MDINVIGGYAAINISSNPERERWIGVIEGNVYCKKIRRKARRAFEDAKRLYEKSNK